MLRPHAPQSLLFACLALLASCQPFSRTTASFSLPAAWKNAANPREPQPQADLSRWWSAFQDPQLTKLIHQALAQNPSISIAAQRIRQARANQTIATASLLPNANASLSRGNSFSLLDSRDSSSSYSASLSSSWEIDWLAKNQASVVAANANLGSSTENLHSAQAALAAQVATTYINLRTLQARLAVLEKNIKLRAETTQIATWRYQAGIIDALEHTQATSSLESAKASIPSLLQAQQQTQNNLAVLLGQTPQTFTLPSSTQLPNPPTRLATGIPTDILRQRPDLRNAQYQILAAAAAKHNAIAAQFPSIQLSGSLGISTLRAEKLFNPDAIAGNLVAGLTAPIFNAGRIRAQITSQDAALNQSISNFQSTLLQALSEVENSLIACKQTNQRLVHLQIARNQAATAATLAQQRYQAGLTDILTVISAQQNLLSLEESLLSTQADRASSFTQLYTALGGGW